MSGPLVVLYHDAGLVAVAKPPGLLVHRSGLDHGERAAALQRVRRQLGRRVYPVHRLDKATSGVLLFALDPETAARLGAAFTDGSVTKRYVAIVRGWPPPEGEINHPIVDRDRRRNDPDAPARDAVTRFHTRATIELPIPVGRYPGARYALVEAQPLTGRRHQIRRHLKHIAHPVVGDTTYGRTEHNRLFRERFDCQRLLLAAVELELTDPVDGHRLRLTAPLDGCFARVVEAFGWRASLPADWLVRGP